ncbi:glutamate--tRNA ligase [Rickettsiales endosymbiont of Peranema trichophorum]|uniref:glutamate--tRNA ligase n=1 Tax=Rickettsiales endosymbiont of Peranema trichophorum TaxID=2486577 RepID=UPI001023599B|nr:glutamate--tRNA ligase [Rickettsiales endosymbiont of Peranema trichophorum]RZI47543.1 glutamate--tRNA ligase [Rickettsiales endosymbiont of Peranema trichophorum]
MITRFAPSPTGYLHIGNARTAIFAWLLARSQHGRFILRIDDTDRERSRPEYVDGILEDLRWLGLDWDGLFYQSARLSLYEEAKNKLIEMGRLYPCYESQQELDLKRKSMLSKNAPPIYDRQALQLSQAEKQKLEESGVQPHWRFCMLDEEIKWMDGVKGEVSFLGGNISDPILIRADGSMTYTIASVMDDIDMNITHIIRGEDHVTNSAIHTQIFKALGAKVPTFAHLSLVKSNAGEISKRIGGFDIRSLREAGIEPMAINSLLSKIGTSEPVVLRESLEELIGEFALDKLSRSPVTYDIKELETLNTGLIHKLPYRTVVERLGAPIQGFDEKLWGIICGNISNIKEVGMWTTICYGSIEPVIEDLDFTKLAADLLPEGIVDEGFWDKWSARIKEATSKSGYKLFRPIRLALTGLDKGPELNRLLPLLGKDKIVARLNGLTA